MEVRIKHPTVEGGQTHIDPTWKFDPNQPHITEAPTIINAGNSLGYTDIETDDYDFDANPNVEFLDEQPTKAANKWVAEYKKNPDQTTWPTAKAKKV